jgi:hypothetical protein
VFDIQLKKLDVLGHICAGPKDPFGEAHSRQPYKLNEAGWRF